MSWLEHLPIEKIPARAAAIALVLLGIAAALDYLIQLAVVRSIRLAQAEHDPDLVTRLYLTRRLLRAILWLVFAALIASHFQTLRTLGTTILASAGVLGVVVGIAARSTVANAIAGIHIAFTQPVRVGDLIKVRSETGEVEDITLTYTFVKTIDNGRLAIPNDVLSSEIIRNLTLRDPAILVGAQFSLGYGVDLEPVKAILIEAARACPATDPGRPVSFAVVEAADAVMRVKVLAWAKTPLESMELGNQILEAGITALQRAGVVLPGCG